MNPKKINLGEIISKIRSIDFIFLLVITIFFVIIAVLFFYSTSFILKNINKIFSSEDVGEAWVLDKTSYALVEKKLQLPINITRESQPVNKEIAESLPEITSPVLDKKSVTISIMNSTTKKGVATTLAKSLENAGFSTATTGNQKEEHIVTTIIIKDSKKDFATSIEEVVKKSYPKAVTEITSEETEFDITIIIGKE